MVKAYIQLIAQHKAQANADIIHEKLSASVMHMSKCYAKRYVHKNARRSKEERKTNPKLQKQLPNSKWVAHAKLSPQASIGGLFQGLGQDVGYLIISGYMGQLDITLLIMISQEVEPHVYMLGARVQDGVLG